MIGKSKILRIDEHAKPNWYDEIDPLSFYEKHFENTFLSKINDVYPDFVGISFSLEIENTLGEKSKPDLAIIKKDYSEWYIIEAEMSRHSWDNHVEKQVRVFTQGKYNKSKVSDYIISKDISGTLLKSELEKMIDNIPPKVMVVVNEPKPDWLVELKRYKAYLSIFQIYKGVDGFEIFRVEGHTPFVYRDQSHCDFVKGSSNILAVYTPEFIKEGHGDELFITFKGRKTIWIKQSVKDKVYLIFKGQTIFLQLEKKYVLYVNDKNEYYLEFN